MFALRNPSYAVKNVRNLPSVRRAMKAHRAEHSECAWCGRSKAVHVHHLIPVSVDPSLAGDPSNLITLCAKRCHITVGHFGNWRTFNSLCVTQCFLAYPRP